MSEQEEPKPKTDWQKREVGALWKKDGVNQKYLTGHVKNDAGELQKLVIFSNKNKTKDNQPDFRIYKSEEYKGEETQQEEVSDELL